MSRGESNDDGADPLLSEQRRSFDRQVDVLARIDDKAARTVRITILTLGVTVSAASVAERGGRPFPLFSVLSGGVGLLALLSTAVLGIATFDETAYKIRLTDDEYDSLRRSSAQAFSEQKQMSELYRNWSKDAQRKLGQKSELLAATQLGLLVGVTMLFTSVCWLVVSTHTVVTRRASTHLGYNSVAFILLIFINILVVSGLARGFQSVTSGRHTNSSVLEED